MISATHHTRERAFLVGLEYVSRARSAERVPTAARQSREAAIRSSEETCVVKGTSEAGGQAPIPSSRLPYRKTQLAIPQFTLEESLAELRELAASAGADVVGEFLQQRDKPDPATLIGRGKLEEIAGAVASARGDLVIFDHELSPSQQRNLEDSVGVRVVDRTQLILDIFARHAHTREGQLQVELAQLEYLMPRLAGRGRQMSQLGGGIGTRGPGETQLETDRRKISRRIRHIREQLQEVRRIRAQQRRRRESVPLATVALTGYTNAGKSTLFNALTHAGVLQSAKMFATLDPTIRSIALPSKRQVLLSDTVGFIRNLPHTLVSAFRATLEEVQRASLILQVTDAASPIALEQDAQVETVLCELQAHTKPRLHVFNKIDLLPPAEREALSDVPGVVHVSAASGTGLTTLLEAIDMAIAEDPLSRVRLRVPQSEGKVLSQVQARALVFTSTYHDGMVEFEAQAPESLLRKIKQFVIE
jgi:GTP-binding protein HflX